MERIIRLLVVASSVFAQSEFIFWAELTSKDYILFYQNEIVSPAMTSTENASFEYACEIPYTQKDLTNLKKDDFGMIDEQMPKAMKYNFLKLHKSELIECFTSAHIKVRDIVETNFLQAKSATYVKMLPLRFSVEFKENSAIIYTLMTNN